MSESHVTAKERYQKDMREIERWLAIDLIKPEDAKDRAAALLAVLKAAEAEEAAATQEPQTSDHDDQQPQISGTDQRNNGDSGHGDNNNDDKTPALRRDDSDDEGDLGDVVITNTEPAPLKPVKPPGQLSLFGAWGKTDVVRRKQKVGAEPEYVRDSGATRCAYTSIEASIYHDLCMHTWMWQKIRSNPRTCGPQSFLQDFHQAFDFHTEDSDVCLWYI